MPNDARVELRFPRLVRGVHRDLTGRSDEPLRFHLSIDRGLASGKLDDIEVDERDLLELIESAAHALRLLRSRDV
jgi:hypothetical protein